MIKKYDKHTSLRTPPKNLRPQDLHLFSHEFSKEIHETSIEIVRNVDILNDIIFSLRELRFYSEHTHVYPVSRHIKIKSLKLFFKPFVKVKKAVWIIDNWSLGYFHWITDALPRLIVSKGLINSHIILLPLAYRKESFIPQSLKLLNFKFKFYRHFKRVHVEELLLPSHTGPSGNFNKEILNLLRKEFSRTNAIEPSKKIYISRQNASKRRITNENEILSTLIEYGFEVHYFEAYDLSRQISLMQEATHLIGSHGAGLTNMLFMPANSKVLELRNEADDHNNCYFTMASELEFEYYYLLNVGDSKDLHTVNITVDIEELETVIKQMLNQPACED